MLAYLIPVHALDDTIENSILSSSQLPIQLAAQSSAFTKLNNKQAALNIDELPSPLSSNTSTSANINHDSQSGGGEEADESLSSFSLNVDVPSTGVTYTGATYSSEMHSQVNITHSLGEALSQFYPVQGYLGQNPPVSKANERANEQALIEHLQLLALATDNSQFSAYMQLMKHASEAKKMEFIDSYAQAIIDFWLAHKVSLPHYSSFKSTGKNNYSALNPAADDYASVISHIQRLTWLADHTSWQQIKLNGLLRPWDGHAAIKMIGERLWLLGDLMHYDAEQYTYQGDLVEAVMRFQLRHGLNNDAVIGPKTLFWLNQTPTDKATILASNFVDKTLYLASLPSRYLLVNIPSFELFLIDQGQPVLHSRVIVGKPYRQTPLVVGRISNVVINPTWTVPRNLLRADILPQIQNDGNYINQREFDAFDYQGQVVSKTADQWQSIAGGYFPYRLVQKPGAINALGRYKFHFNNDDNIYLHDTPNKELFAQADRALSSGCIRIEKVQQLAQWFADNLVIDQRTWRLLQSNYDRTQWFALKDTLPVHFVYWTAWVDSHNQAQFRGDIYGKYPKSNADLASMKLKHL
ncbi:L,D-transpeptidase family protein [Shewanella sp. OMA3-2]|uniref:L,D-transpeptidase family protein n=1 Tax=Shewanella sp. OMA3-2 TaxID=2908650 RepID=UPI001F02BF89|nr:L,D-transpeptidase family protein [Shewanella sp. OMA3-2]UJF23402.1 L,D-transpeptidase family protein [Shewanella sp. OMA3-2]